MGDRELRESIILLDIIRAKVHINDDIILQYTYGIINCFLPLQSKRKELNL